MLAYDHNTLMMDGPWPLSLALDVDDHAHPSILVRTDGKLLVAYSAHNGSKAYCRLSSSAEDPSAWGSVVDITGANANASYPSLMQLTAEENNPVYCVLRAVVAPLVDRSVCVVTSTDGGVTWGTPFSVFSVPGQRPYFHVVQNGIGRIDFVVTDGHPNEVATNSLYHFYYTGGNYYKSDGTLIGDATALPLETTDVTKIFDGATIRCWVWEVAIDGDGRPRVAFTTFPTATDHRYNYAYWTGTEWVVKEICAAGGPLYVAETYYSGGVTIDHADTNTIYLSKSNGSQWDLWKYVTADDGDTWVATQLTNDSTLQFRPVVPRSADASVPVVYLEGTYTTYENYDTDVVPLVVS